MVINELCIIVSSIRDLNTMQGREGHGGNGSGHGKRSRVPLCRQRQNAYKVV